jgi:hypothetical protein
MGLTSFDGVAVQHKVHVPAADRLGIAEHGTGVRTEGEENQR